MSLIAEITPKLLVSEVAARSHLSVGGGGLVAIKSGCDTSGQLHHRLVVIDSLGFAWRVLICIVWSKRGQILRTLTILSIQS
jgi:hypothetical protein